MTDQSADGQRRNEGLRELSNAVAASGEPQCLIDGSGTCVAVSGPLLDALGKHREELLGHTVVDAGARDSLGPLLGALLERARAQGSASEHRWWDFPSWGFRYVEITLDTLGEQGGARAGTLVRLRDVTDARLARDALEESERRFEDFAALADGWLFELNAELRFVYLSSGFERVMDLDRAEVLGRRRAEAFPDEDMAAPDTRAHLRDLESRRPFRDYRLVRRLRDGALRIFSLSARPAYDAEGRFLAYRGVARDATERERLAARVAESESRDGLTRLLNRNAFVQRLGRVLETASTRDDAHGLCWLDVDQFRLINESCGHGAGDELLRALADILRDQVRRRDTLARIGDDEFAILMEHCSLEQLHRVAHAVRRAVQDYRFLWDHEAFTLGVSIGVLPIDGSLGGVDEV
ncbi:MAG: diguanylate cyclase, partial [Gammaproteobacteria bacterium]|nr:diguanylate cyclase [Gammaproteobacteria bacterium]